MTGEHIHSSEVRLLVLCAGDPENERTFSGSARSLIEALERRGCIHHKANVLGWSDPFVRGSLPVRLLRKLDRRNWERKYRYSAHCLKGNSQRGRAIASAHPGFNACLMYGTNYHPRLDVPTYCYFDATAAQIAKAKSWSYATLTKTETRRIIGLQQEVFDHCAAIFPRTRYAGHSVEHDYGIAPEKVVPAGAGPNHYADPLPHGPYDNKNILFIGREFDRKGGPLILEAFRKTRETVPDATLTIIGCSPNIDEPGVRIVGPIKKDESGGLEALLTHYSRAALFCIMSTFEPFGIVIIEAQNSYVPCVVPARFAFTETVLDGATGRHVPDDDPETLAGIFTELLQSPDTLAAMGQAGHDFVRREWTWDKAAERIHCRIEQDLKKASA
jgi:glycosyltransferase involved in cell wall biosynthesis